MVLVAAYTGFSRHMAHDNHRSHPSRAHGRWTWCHNCIAASLMAHARAVFNVRAGTQQLEARLLLRRLVGRVSQPIILGSLKVVPAFLHQCLVPLAPNLVYGSSQTLHYVNLVKGHLPLRLWHMLQRGVDVGWSHVHANTLDPLQLLQSESSIPLRKCFLLTVFAHMQHRTHLRIRNNGDICVALAKRSLIHANMGHIGFLSARKTALHRTLHDSVY